jgi:hypothetical protein
MEMKKLHKLIYITVGALSLSAMTRANAQVITDAQWNFEEYTAPDVGSSFSSSSGAVTGTASSLGMNNTYAVNGTASTSTDASGVLVSTLAPNTSNVFRIVGTGSHSDNGWNSVAPLATQGAQFVASTTGLDDIKLSFDIDITAQGSANLVVQYTTNGTTWTDTSSADYTSEGTANATLGTGALTLKNNTSSTNTVSGAYLSGLGDAVGNTDTWFQGVTVNLSDISGVNNDANFGVRIVNASTGADDFALKEGGSGNTTPELLNNTSGNWRLDNVTISGTEIAPEPSTYALMLGGFVLLLGCQRIRKGRAQKS